MTGSSTGFCTLQTGSTLIAILGNREIYFQRFSRQMFLRIGAWLEYNVYSQWNATRKSFAFPYEYIHIGKEADRQKIMSSYTNKS